ncbi:MAG: hypothetical protein JNM83_14030 [Myxococcales bacterium]|jgi:hypothetical protein|nr:hypothetical protein [Myxococcales bacterium]
MRSLAAALFSEIQPEFFRVLAGKSAPIYLEALEALEQAMRSATALSRSDALDVVIDVLRANSELSIADDFPTAESDAATIQGQAGLILRRLVEVGWLHEPGRPDWQRIVHFSANGEILLAALRQIAKGEPSQFTDKLQLACAQLLNPEGFVENPYADLEACLDNVRQGLRELRQMANGVARHSRNLLRAETLKANLAVLYDEFSESFGHACYRELVHAQLHTKIHHAVRRLDDVSQSEKVLARMQRERLRRQPECDAESATNEIRLKLDELGRLLESVGPQVDELDRRTAEFARKAFARIRYLQEVSGGQREKVQRIFSWVDENYAGTRLNELPESLGLPSLFITEATLLSGDSLRKPVLRRKAGEVEPIDEELTPEDRDDALKEIENSLRESMNILRANRFVARLAGERGTKFDVTELPLENQQDVSDLVACLLYTGSRDSTFQIETVRAAADVSDPPQHVRAGYHIEGLVLEKR